MTAITPHDPGVLEDAEVRSPDAGAEPSRPAVQLTPEQHRQRRRLAGVGVVILAAIGFLVYKGLTSAAVYFKTTPEAVAQRTTLGNADFQLEGTVAAGSVHELPGGRVAFAVTGGGKRIAVVNSGSPPQLFKPGVPVVLVGHFVGATDGFSSSEILVKHSNVYIAAHPNRVRASDGSKQ
jgi:cytochrome c-type biogenesis protein CcmE